jgi:hypothetical protein
VLDDVKVRESIIADVEARSAELMQRLGAKAGTQNIDRILRLPGTTNLPNAKKRRAGRVPCPTRLLNFNGVSYPLDAFVPGAAEDGGHHARQEDHKKNGRAAVDVDALPVSDRIKDLIRGIHDPEHTYDSRSEAVFAVVMAMLSAKCFDQQIQDVMFDKCQPIGEHVREQPNPVDYLVRQIRHALAKIGGPDAVIREIKIQPRMEEMLGAQLGEWPARLTYATSWPRLNEGGLNWIREWISKSPNRRLIVIDILERVRQLAASKDKRSAYSADY